jgi:uncharacterized protein (DUF934 family)
MPLVKSGRIVEDRYVRVDDEAPIPERVPVIVTAKRFLADPNALIKRDGSLGVLWPNDRRVAELEPWLGHLALIALVFPKFRDGRAYSQARQLRERYGFRGELRATGDVLRDQFQFLLRAGFDAFEVKKPADAAVFAEAAARFSVFYQPGADGGLPALRQRLQGAPAARVEPTGPARSGRPDDRLRETGNERSADAPDPGSRVASYRDRPFRLGPVAAIRATIRT